MHNWHKVFAHLVSLALGLIMFAGYWILLKYGADDDEYFWIGILVMIIAGLAMLPVILPTIRGKGR